MHRLHLSLETQVFFFFLFSILPTSVHCFFCPKADEPKIIVSTFSTRFSVLGHSVVFDSATPWNDPPGSSVHGNSSSKNTGLGCLALLQEHQVLYIFKKGDI